MKCPYCPSHTTRVVDKRNIGGSDIIRRRRACTTCLRRFTTYERIELPELFVLKKDRTREAFVREKLILGIQKSTEKRPISNEQVYALAQSIEQSLRKKGATTVPSKSIGDMVMCRLRKLDKVAYVRFASVYRSFESPAEFQTEIQRLVTHARRARAPVA